MNTTSAIFKRTYDASRCRRRRDRVKLNPSEITCWNGVKSPTSVSSIEIDSRGARLVLPWNTNPGEHVKVSLSDDLGHHRTTKARIVWTQKLPNSPKTIAGLAFEEEVIIAA